MKIINYFEELLKFFQNQAALLYVLLVFSAAIALTYIIHLIYQKLTEKLIQRGHFIIQTFVQVAYWPLIVFIWIETTAINVSFFIPQVDASVIVMIEKWRRVSLIILLAWIFIHFIKVFEEQLLQERLASGRTDKTMIQAMGKLLRIVAFSVVALLILPVLGVEITGLLAFASGSAIIVGIAAQQIIANYFGGIVIYSDGHFKVGDWIYSPDKAIEGVVEYIGWRSTQIRTFDRKILYVPNALFSSIIIINATRMTNRRINETINLRYEDIEVLDRVIAAINGMLQAHPGLDKYGPLLVHFAEFGTFSVKINVYAFTRSTDWHTYRDVRQDIFLKITRIIRDNGARIALPPTVGYIE